MASGTNFEFKGLKSEASKLKLTIGGQKGATLVCEVNNLETAIRENDIGAFDEACKSIDKLIFPSKTKAKTFVAKFSELKAIVDKGRGRGNPLQLIKIEGERPETGQQVREGQGSRKQGSLYDVSGNKRPLSKTKSSTPIQDESKLYEKQLSVLRHKLYDACKKYTELEPLLPQKTADLGTYISETEGYANLLIEHLEMKSGVKGVRGVHQNAHFEEMQTKKEQEARQMIEKVNAWLDRLQQQIDENVFDEREFKSSKDSCKWDDKKTRRNIADICVKLKNRKDAEKEDVLTESRAIYKSFLDKRMLLCKKKEVHFNRTAPNMISETDTINLLREISVLQKELIDIADKEEEELLNELQELKTDIEKDWTNDIETVEKPTKLAEGPRKLIRTMRLEILKKTRKMMKDSKSMSDKEQDRKSQREHIKKIWHKLNKHKQPRATPPDTTTILAELEELVTSNTEKLCQYEETINSNAQDMNNLKEKIQTIRNNMTTGDNADQNEKNENEPMKMLNFLETCLINNRKRLDLFNSIRKDLETEISRLQQETEAHNWNNQAFGSELKINKNTPQLLIDVSQIKKNLKERKEETNKKEEEMKKKENWIKDKTTKLWRTVCENSVTGAGHVTGGDGKDIVVKMFSDINEKLQKWDHDRKDVQAFTSELEVAVEEIQNIITAEPFSFTDPQPFDHDAVVRNTSTVAFHPVKIKLVWVIKCLKKNQKSFPDRYVKMERYSAVQENENILHRHLEKLETEKLELLNRLSKVAGARLTDNNPNIADLSDQNRPTKIGEKYSELYDNGWTDALEVLDMQEEKQRVEYLLNILVVSYKACEEISVSQQRTIIRALTSPSEVMTAENRGVMSGKDAELSSVQSRALVELRKQSTDLSVGSVKKHVKKEYKDWFKRKELEKYTTECIDLCWLMHVQSPPVCLETKVKPGSKFDSNIYKSFTKNGKKIDFLVWPALLLHEKGSVVCKGVAQLK